MEKTLTIVVLAAVPVALLLCLVLFLELRRAFAVTKLYAAPGRDLRFICALLRYYLPGGKWRILRSPCLLSDDRGTPPRADLLVIGGGGVLILTVDDREGHFSTPPTGDWTLWEKGSMRKVENRFTDGRQYTQVLNGILVRMGLSCPVLNLVVLSDDHAAADDLYGENVLTGNQLVAFAKRFCRGRDLSHRDQKKLRETIVAHHGKCKRALAAAETERLRTEAPSYTAENLFDFSANDGQDQQ